MKPNATMLLLGMAAAAAVSLAQGQPAEQPIRFVLPLPPGGPTDTLARVVAPKLSQALGQPVIVENRPGGDGVVAAETVLATPTDGRSILWGGSSTIVGVPLLHKNPPYKPLEDFAPITLLGRFALCLFLNPEVPAQSLPQLVEYARSRPGALNYFTVTVPDAMAAAQLAKAANLTMVRVPYKGPTQAMQDLIAGRVQLGFGACAVGLGHAKEGRLRTLASLLPERTAITKDVPTIAEAGLPEVSVSGWVGLFARAGTPDTLIDRLSRELNAILRHPDVELQFERNAVQRGGTTPRELQAFVRKELGDWAALIRDTGMTLN
jgi:tripartite-type tricarboxylate transporter receptor subunit TctC